MKNTPKRRTLVLLSGGLDSAACVHFYASHGRGVDTLFVDYGQAARISERRAAAKISKHYGSNHCELKLIGSKSKREGVIRGRNAFLLLTALIEWQEVSGTVAMGVH